MSAVWRHTVGRIGFSLALPATANHVVVLLADGVTLDMACLPCPGPARQAKPNNPLDSSGGPRTVSGRPARAAQERPVPPENLGTINAVPVKTPDSPPPPARQLYCVAFQRWIDGKWHDTVSGCPFKDIRDADVERYSSDPRCAKIRIFEIEGEDK